MEPFAGTWGDRRLSRLVVLVAVALLVAASSAQARKKKVQPPLCSDHRYVVSGAPLAIGGGARSIW